jgi:FkbM family methyltransferase
MNRFINYYKWLGGKDFFTLLCGMLLDVFHKRIPKKLFLNKIVFDYVQERKGKVARSKDVVQIEIDEIKYILRTKGSDIKVFHQIILDEGFKRILELMSGLDQAETYVLDCGANIGLTTILMKKKFPNTRIISLEPEPGNYSQLLKNLSINGCNDVVPLQMGVWHKKATLAAVTDFRDGESWSFSLKPGDGTYVFPVDTPQAILHANGWNRTDVLKIDIEGSEFSLLRNVVSWGSVLDSVRIISLEVHEEVGSLFEISEILRQRGFLLEKHGELLIGVKN